MTYNELLTLFKNDEFRKIDKERNAKKFYLLRSISKSKTLSKFCDKYNLEKDLNKILDSKKVSEEDIIDFIRKEFIPKSEEEIVGIETELNKMQNFDWGGSAGNNLESNIVNNFIKKMYKYDDIQKAIVGAIQTSVYGYTLNSWYNHWSSILIEELFNSNKRILPTIDLVQKIDFFIDGVPFDLKVTFFPDELMKADIGVFLQEKYRSKSELTCAKKIAREVGISIPRDLNDRALTICLYNLLNESVDSKAKEYLNYIKQAKKYIIKDYQKNPNKLITWLYENQGERRFDASNRFFIVLIDTEDIFNSWKLKRNVRLIKDAIDIKLKKFSSDSLNHIKFYWQEDGKTYDAISELLFITK